MQILVLLSLSFTVALGLPLSPPDVTQQSLLPKEEQSPLLGDVVPDVGGVQVQPEARVEDEDQLAEDAALRGEPRVRRGFYPEDRLDYQYQYEESYPDYVSDYEAVGDYGAVGEEGALLDEPSDAELAEAEQNVLEAFLGPDAEPLPRPTQDPTDAELAEAERNVLEAFLGPDAEPLPQRRGALEPEVQSSAGEPQDAGEHGEGPQIGEGPGRRRRSVTDEDDGGPAETEQLQKQDKTGWRVCPGVLHEGKCYRFFRLRKGAADAEFFCRRTFPDGHLASITSPHIHRAVLSDMRSRHGVLTRAWVGGLRYLNTGRFVWLDGSHWRYQDWLVGEPSRTASKGDCVELLAHRNGKFNDFTCSEHQAFICSYTPQ